MANPFWETRKNREKGTFQSDLLSPQQFFSTKLQKKKISNLFLDNPYTQDIGVYEKKIIIFIVWKNHKSFFRNIIGGFLGDSNIFFCRTVFNVFKVNRKKSHIVIALCGALSPN